jgi:hypothetical protein
MNVTTVSSVEELRRQGFQVRVTHLRPLVTGANLSHQQFKKAFGSLPKEKRMAWGDFVQGWGGKTIVDVTTPDGRNATKEHILDEYEPFNKRRGLKIALGRAIKELFPKKSVEVATV